MRTLGISFLLVAVSVFAQAPPGAKHLSRSGAEFRKNTRQNFWRPIQPSQVTLFGALENLSHSLEQDRVLASRGVYRSVNFQYKNFTYEKDFFNIYRGFTLKSFWDGRMDLGLFSHKPTRGVIFGPGNNYYRPGASSRYELRLRWNLRDH